MRLPTENIKIRFFENIYKTTVTRANLTVPFNSLDNGIKILETDEECERYVALYAGHHFYKLRAAFASTNFPYLEGRSIEIIDWGCGQAIATCILLDYLIENRISPDIKKITLVEPSRIATAKGCNLVFQMFQNNIAVESIIKVVNKNIDGLLFEDFETNYDNIKIHLFSNIIDVKVFNINWLYELIIRRFQGRNRIICSSPKNSFQRTGRLDSFHKLFLDSYSLDHFFQSDQEINEDVFVVRSGKYETCNIKRYEKQFTVNLPPF